MLSEQSPSSAGVEEGRLFQAQPELRPGHAALPTSDAKILLRTRVQCGVDDCGCQRLSAGGCANPVTVGAHDITLGNLFEQGLFPDATPEGRNREQLLLRASMVEVHHLWRERVFTVVAGNGLEGMKEGEAFGALTDSSAAEDFTTFGRSTIRLKPLPVIVPIL